MKQILLATASVALVSVTCLTAVDEGVAPLGTYSARERQQWEFQPRKDVQPPALTDPAAKAWIKSPVDAFILAGLRKAGLKPAPLADRATLLRRVTFDLIGLPPTPEEIDAFVNDKSPRAWEKVIDRLLASPHYGEQWGRHWLDVVRFAESDGYEYDMHRPDAWRYRDYVVQSFNEDKPYNDFVKEQLAGDEMDSSNKTYLVASGFNRLGPLRKNAGNQDVASSHNEVLTEMTNIVGAAFLGVTVGCARCHDHKFDPFRQSDYYRLQAHFAQLQPNDIILASKQEQEAWKAKSQPVENERRRLQFALRRAPESDKAKLEADLDALDDKMPAPLESIYSVVDDPAKAAPIKVLFHGDYLNPTATVGVRTLGVLLADAAPEAPIEEDKPRLKLAEWIVDPANPLTARVMANRVWQYHLGRGIVSTANDFGLMGSRPSNRDLLDWLANRFIEEGWRLKPLHRMILLSSAYRQSSISPMEKEAEEKDSENALVWKFSHRRLEAEEIRDAMLAVSGRLNPKAGGPSFMVPIDPELVLMLKRPQYWVATRDKSEYNRRTIYMIYKRNLRLPFEEVFDAPDTLLSCARREQSTHAPQALELLNGQTSNELAAVLAERLLKERRTPAARVDYAFRLAAGRLPSRLERSLAMKFLAGQPDDPQAIKEFALAVFNLNAFLYVN
ncbi:MAG TPA: DUF1549 and DUF1553 domain-containing protein [Bryobacteraceae bacterium]|nr:DUF1549 and DUF1553 domain-containing protein [Bryobacteraceae bacterium]